MSRQALPFSAPRWGAGRLIGNGAFVIISWEKEK